MSIETEYEPINTTLKSCKIKRSIIKQQSDSAPSNSNPSKPPSKPPSKSQSKWCTQKAKRKRRKQRKRERRHIVEMEEKKLYETKALLDESQTLLNEIDYISDTLSDAAKNNFSKAFERFTPAEDLFKTKEELMKEAADKEKLKKQREKEEKEKLRREDPIDAAILDNNSNGNKERNASKIDKVQTLSNKQRKRRHRPSIARLKKGVIRSDLVEEHDVNAPNPFLLIDLKSMRNTVPVPAHWLQKRKYLQGKRGFLKPPFRLPSYIEATGITKMRENRLNLLNDKSMKQKQREKMRPKKGGLEISYNILHEAFFRHQTKPDVLTGFGDLYYEGKEFMMKFRKFKPGFISDNLKKALSMTPRYRVVSPGGVMVKNKRCRDNDGEDIDLDIGNIGNIEWYDVQELKYGQYVVWDEHAGPKRIKISAPVTGYVWLSSKDGKEELLKRCDVEDPPPWLINMQRFGPPPSYPDLKIPGLNAPIPTHKMYGFHEGQWGKPPVDENGQPLYGDPFGIWTEPISKSWGGNTRWGVLEKYDDTDTESDDDEDDNEDNDDDDNDNHDNDQEVEGQQQDTVMNGDGIAQISLLKNTVIDNDLNGIETPTSGISTQEVMLRNQEEGKELYQVLEETDNTVRGKFGSSTIYKIPPTSKRRNEAENEPHEPPTKKRRQN